jgi:hypothetical protein
MRAESQLIDRLVTEFVDGATVTGDERRTLAELFTIEAKPNPTAADAGRVGELLGHESGLVQFKAATLVLDVVHGPPEVEA